MQDYGCYIRDESGYVCTIAEKLEAANNSISDLCHRLAEKESALFQIANLCENCNGIHEAKTIAQGQKLSYVNEDGCFDPKNCLHEQLAETNKKLRVITDDYQSRIGACKELLDQKLDLLRDIEDKNAEIERLKKEIKK